MLLSCCAAANSGLPMGGSQDCCLRVRTLHRFCIMTCNRASEALCSTWTGDAGGSMRRFAEAAFQGTGGVDCAVVSGGVAARCNKVCRAAPLVLIALAHRAPLGQVTP